jgi:hypothetical protein
MKEIGKTEKRKEEKKIKIEKGLRGTVRPRKWIQPAAQLPSPRNGTTSSLSPSPTRGPHVVSIISLPQPFLPSLETAAMISPFNSALIPARSFSAPRL